MRKLLRPRSRRAAQPLAVRVDYRVGPFIRWCATLSSPLGEFEDSMVWAEDAEGIYLAALTALDALRRDSGRQIEAEHVPHEELVGV